MFQLGTIYIYVALLLYDKANREYKDYIYGRC